MITLIICVSNIYTDGQEMMKEFIKTSVSHLDSEVKTVTRSFALLPAEAFIVIYESK